MNLSILVYSKPVFAVYYSLFIANNKKLFSWLIYFSDYCLFSFPLCVTISQFAMLIGIHATQTIWLSKLCDIMCTIGLWLPEAAGAVIARYSVPVKCSQSISLLRILRKFLVMERDASLTRGTHVCVNLKPSPCDV